MRDLSLFIKTEAWVKSFSTYKTEFLIKIIGIVIVLS
jgi:hypothetical protein